VSDSDERPDLNDLIRRAFAVAQQSGRSAVDAMTLPVLKNRLLQLTDRKFNEQAYGFGSFRELIRRAAADVVSLNEETRPATVTLRKRPPEAAARRRVRPDIWRAVLDYSSGQRYVWDQSAGLAIATTDPNDTRPRIPTVNAATIEDWRIQFLERTIPLLDDPEKERLQKWQTDGFTTSALPGQLRVSWNELLKRQVRDVWNTWVSANGIDVDADVPQVEGPPLAGDTGVLLKEGPSTYGRHGDLRRFLLACIERMTDDELIQITIPIQIMVRLAGDRIK
jgi:hypothetical protein